MRSRSGEWAGKPLGDPKLRVQELSEELDRASQERLQEDYRHKKWEEKLSNSLNQQRKLSTHLMTAREEERMNVSREIHEDLGQMLAALQLNVSLLTMEYNDHEQLVARAKVMERLITSSIASGLMPRRGSTSIGLKSFLSPISR